MASKCSGERKSLMSFSLNQKLEMVKLSEEGMLKAEIGQKLGFGASQPSCECKGKVLKKNDKCDSSEHMNDKKAKQSYC